MSGPLRTFPLTRYFVLASFVATLGIALILGRIITQEVRRDLLDGAKEHAVLVIRHLQEEIRSEFIQPKLDAGIPIDPEAPEQYAELDAIVTPTARAFGIQAVYIFDRDGRILYSTHAEHLGVMTPRSNELFFQALEGEVASAVRNRGAPLDLPEVSSPDRALLETYVPVRSLVDPQSIEGPVTNVIEAYQDIDKFQREIEHAQIRVAWATAAGALLLLGILVWIVRFAEKLIRQRTDELVTTNRRLTELSRNLEAEVDRRTRELIQREKLASLGTLSAGVAHEVNNPLATVVTCAQALRSRLKELVDGGELDRASFEEYLALIEEEAFRVKDITRSLLDFSRQQREDDPTEVEILPVLEKTVDILTMGPGFEGITVRLPEDGHTIWGDPSTFQQLAFNLMRNAADAIAERREREPGRKGEIRWAAREDEDQLILTVTDDGAGFDPERASELVEPFVTTKKPGEGTGLGLALCHSMAERLGGTLSIESEGPDRGATVRLSLPMKETHR